LLLKDPGTAGRTESFWIYPSRGPEFLRRLLQDKTSQTHARSTLVAVRPAHKCHGSCTKFEFDDGAKKFDLALLNWRYYLARFHSSTHFPPLIVGETQHSSSIIGKCHSQLLPIFHCHRKAHCASELQHMMNVVEKTTNGKYGTVIIQVTTRGRPICIQIGLSIMSYRLWVRMEPQNCPAVAVSRHYGMHATFDGASLKDGRRIRCNCFLEGQPMRFCKREKIRGGGLDCMD